MHGNEFAGQRPVARGVPDYGITYPAVDDVGGQVYKAYGIKLIPSWSLIGKDGAIIRTQVGGAAIPQVQKLIEDALR